MILGCNLDTTAEHILNRLIDPVMAELELSGFRPDSLCKQLVPETDPE